VTLFSRFRSQPSGNTGGQKGTLKLPLLILELFVPPVLHSIFPFLPYYTSLQEYSIFRNILSLACLLPVMV